MLLPVALKVDVLTQLHQHGHQGIESTGELVRQCATGQVCHQILFHDVSNVRIASLVRIPSHQFKVSWVIFWLRDQTQSWPLTVLCWSRPVQGLITCWSLQIFSANTLLLCLLGTSEQRLWLRPW